MHIVYVSDGKAGHRSQALGLFQAMQRERANATFEEVSINDLPIFSLIKALFLQKVSISTGTRFYIWCRKSYAFSSLVAR